MHEITTYLRKLATHTSSRIIESLEELGAAAAEKVSKGAYGHMSSRIDVIAEDALFEALDTYGLSWNVFTEERGFVDNGDEYTLIVDPLDGSYNAEHGIPFFSVSLALSRGGLNEVEYALVRNVSCKIDYWAERGQGAYKNGTRIKVKDKTNLFVIYLGKKSHPRAFEIARKVRRVRSFGSASLEMIMVAEGIADGCLYIFKSGGALRIVDIAASTLIVREAGGLVLDDEFSNLSMNLDFKERKNVICVSGEHVLEVFE